MSQTDSVAASSPAAPRPEKESPVNKAALRMLLAASISAIGPLLHWITAWTMDSFLAMVLLLLPSFLIVFGAIRLLPIQQRPDSLTRGVTTFDTAKNVLVLAHVCLPFGRLLQGGLAFLSFATAGVLVTLIYLLTAWIANDHLHDVREPGSEKPEWREGVIRQLLQHRFLSICGLLVAYLHLVFLLSLAIAFYDRAVDGGSIQRQVRRRNHTALADTPRVSASRIRTFTFPLGSTTLRCTTLMSDWPVAADFFDERNTNKWRVTALREAATAERPIDKECLDELPETAWNVLQLHLLKSDLANIYGEAQFDRYHAAIVSHATDNRQNSGFSSNYEMSKARAEQVQALIQTTLLSIRGGDEKRPPLNIEWQIVPSGTSDWYLSAPKSAEVGRLQEAGLRQALTTEVQLTRVPDHLTQLQREIIEPHKVKGETELQLLDYLYFMTTMATPNDLAPASGVVQFVAAAGHISQLFLLVVAFNVILAFRRPMINGNARTQD